MGKGTNNSQKTATEAAALIDAGERIKAARPKRVTEVLIDGTVYDVTDFAKRHPGGSIINFCDGEDATTAWNEFHSRSTTAKKYLKSLKSRPAGPNDPVDTSPMINDFTKLRADLIKEGFFEPSLPHVAYRIAEIVVLGWLGFWLVLNGYMVPGLIILGITQGRCGWLMHEGGHHSMTGNITTDHFLQVVIYGLGCGMSAAFWRNQHNKHHATPQRLKHDVDLDTMPLVAFNRNCVREGKGNIWIRIQGLCFLPVTTLLVALGWQFFLHPRHSFRVKHAGEIACYLIRFAALFWILRDFTFLGAVAVYVAAVWIGAIYIFGNFALSHTHLPTTAGGVNWVEYAAKHTIDITPGIVCNWWMAYLNFQIEHHLFPSLPQFRHPRVAPRVKALFEKHGLVYDCRDYFAAMKDTLQNLDDVGHDVYQNAGTKKD